MTGFENSPENNRLTLISRLTESLVGRRWGFFAAELVLVVAGILIALAIDGWVSDMHDRQVEEEYLQQLSRDIVEVQQQALLQIDFEKRVVDAGLKAIRLLDSPDPRTHGVELGSLLGAMSVRRTLNLSSATFDEIISSGHLQLIRNRDLRHDLVRFFAEMELRERIAEKNNQDLIDDIYIPFLMRAGVTVQIESKFSDTTNRTVEIMNERLSTANLYPEDRVLMAPPESDSWNDIKRNVLWRTQMAAIGQAGAELILDATDDIAAAIANELHGR